MADERQLPEKLEQVEEALAAITLPSSSIDRDRLMYDAGWAAAEARKVQPPRRAWLWQAATAISSVAAVVLLTVLALRAPMVIREVVYVDPPIAIQIPDTVRALQRPQHTVEPFNRNSAIGGQNFNPSELTYLRLRELALREGINALPAPIYASQSSISNPQDAPTSRQLFSQWLSEQESGRAL